MSSNKTIHMSASGVVEIPESLRTILHWEGAMELEFHLTPAGLLIQPAERLGKAERRLGELRGLLKHEGTPLSGELLCAPVDLGHDA